MAFERRDGEGHGTQAWDLGLGAAGCKVYSRMIDVVSIAYRKNLS